MKDSIFYWGKGKTTSTFNKDLAFPPDPCGSVFDCNQI